ncbi:exodeoxyribonuclease V subunit alpha [Pseudomarimonas arenosa]|uniref:RecBCD enzyme subunit RecD n=1 Tax=Pseudomarimonas arenosa TaxID=2774145 RepID=A0AAW3ZIF6_9GAMM|nr:exodeoxyribonuclease V subunit alpha [Pseudomarimonas arenosa]MBD8524261.1 exodeoxyribonuclease V subunit alpha [Pseudomarimonas arenosa]
MSRFDFAALNRLPADLSDPFEQAVWRWTLAHGGDALLAERVARTARAEAAGDSCLALTGAQASRHGGTALDSQQLQQLRRSSLISDGGHIAPLVIDARQRLYFWRNWRHEQRISEQIVQALSTAADQAASESLEAALQQAFADSDPALDSLQRKAVRQALSRRLLILTGGPGTGKTRTVGRLIEAARRLHGETLQIHVAAPTGKAAQRLNMLFDRDANNVTAAQTVHRLLGFDPDTQRFRHGRELPLKTDLLIVDEVSMLDLGTLRTLLEAVPPSTHLVLMGDAEQLQSVTTGSVLDDIVQALEGIPDSPVVRLQHGFRSEHGLLPVFIAAQQGDAKALTRGADDLFAPISLRSCADLTQRDQRLHDWALQLIDQLSGAVTGQGEQDAARLLQAWQQQQLLCVLNEGPFGASEAALRIEARLREAWRVLPGTASFAGQAIMVRRNDYARGLFNGDLGVLLPDTSSRLRAWFADPMSSRLRSFATGDLPEHASACALTVHKSQGSEFPRVALLLPPDAESRVLSRQLVYTALTRARQRVEIWGDEAVLGAALARRSSRLGGLRDLLVQRCAALRG